MDGFCLAVDTREQLPYSWPEVPTVRKALPRGDYSVVGLEDRVGVERKSHADFVMTVTRHHDAFFEKMKAMGRCGTPDCSGRGWFVVVVEATAAALDSPMPWTRVTPATVHANLVKLACLGVPVHLAGTRDRGQRFTYAFLLRAWEEIRGGHR